jgi:hypothetical protein
MEKIWVAWHYRYLCRFIVASRKDDVPLTLWAVSNWLGYIQFGFAFGGYLVVHWRYRISRYFGAPQTHNNGGFQRIYGCHYAVPERPKGSLPSTGGSRSQGTRNT